MKSLAEIINLDSKGISERRENKILRSGLAQVIQSSDGWDRLNALRKFYALADDQIKAAGRRRWGIYAYEIDWIKVFTPIEYGLWYDIREQGAVLYPQYPVGRFFADFANPVAKVIVECDGAAWHKDKDKDRCRQDEIEAMGWHVYRITGRECLQADTDESFDTLASRKFIERIICNHDISSRFESNDMADCAY
jgi:very-short-patch-repair endonuclease